MNDFTKEELNILYDYLDHACDTYQEPDSSYKLKDKIQFMIDNYCEHEWHTNPYDYILHCQKCGKTTKSEDQGKIVE